MSYYRPIDGTKTVYLNTHLPSTAAEGDADSLPTYEVYEEDTGTPILSGSMAKLNDAGTVGFYVKKLSLTAANGFDAGKEYGVRMRAIVETIPMSRTEVFGIWPSTIPSTVAGSIVALGQGPFSIREAGTGDATIALYVGDEFRISFQAFDGAGRVMPLTGLTATVTVSKVGAPATLIYDDDPATVAWQSGGGVDWDPSQAWAGDAGQYNLTIKFDNGGGNVNIIGGVTVTMQER